MVFNKNRYTIAPELIQFRKDFGSFLLKQRQRSRKPKLSLAGSSYFYLINFDLRPGIAHVFAGAGISLKADTMCRYAMVAYKPHYACFKCRKTFKRRLMWDINRDDKRTVEAKCPQCGELMANMGLDFTAPKRTAIKEWAHLKTLYSVGITFHSCGCSDPGYIPNTTAQLIAYFEALQRGYEQALDCWRHRQEPSNQKEAEQDKHKNIFRITQIPAHIRSGKNAISNEEARQYWLGRIKAVEQKITLVRQQQP